MTNEVKRLENIQNQNNFFSNHMAITASLMSTSLTLSQTTVYIARPWIRL